MTSPSGKITRHEQQLAQSSISQLRNAVSHFEESGFTRIKIEEQEQFLQIPEKAFLLLIEIINNMAEGKSMKLIPFETEISTQQAADILNVSRPYVVKLLERKIIPHKKVGKHRRIELKNLIEYERNLKGNRNQQLDFLAKQAQELNLGY